MSVDEGRFRLFLAVQLAFVFLAPFVLHLAGLFSLDLYFVVWFVWFLIASEVFAPRSSDAGWWRWVNWVKIVGFVVLAYVVTQHISTVIQ